MHTFRKLPKASPSAKIVVANAGSTVCPLPKNAKYRWFCNDYTVGGRPDPKVRKSLYGWTASTQLSAASAFTALLAATRSAEGYIAALVAMAVPAGASGRKTENVVPLIPL